MPHLGLGTMLLSTHRLLIPLKTVSGLSSIILRAPAVRMGEDEEEWERERANEVAYHELLRGPYEGRLVRDRFG